MNRAKKFFTSLSLAVLLLFGLTVPAHAITTLTSSLLFITSVQSVVCSIINVGPHPITVTIQVLNGAGAVLDDGTANSLPAGAAATLGDAGPGTTYCKFTGNFNRGFVRANAQVVEGLTTISVVPAQAVGE
jgi:hypothetical protein